jgi:L-rhamnose isomerase
VGSAFTLLLYVGIVGHYLAQVGVFTKFLDAGLNGIANWALVVLNVLSLLANGLSPSQKEKTLWAPVAFVLLLASLLVAIG